MKALNEYNANVKAETDRITSRYSVSVANEMLSKLRDTKNEYIHTLKSRLKDSLTEIYDAKKARLAEYSMTAPTDEQIRLITALNLRKGNLTDTELNMAIEKCCENYQALASIHTIAEANGKTFIMPFEPERYSNELDVVYNNVLTRIEHMEDDGDYGVMELFNYGMDTTGYVSIKFSELDDSIAFHIDAPELTPMQTLSRELENATEEHDYKKYVKIRRLMEDRGEELKTEAEKKADLDQLISDAIGYANADGTRD